MAATRPEIVFLHTAYVYALVNTRDRWHDLAVGWQRRLASERRRLLTTEFVLVEIADGLAAARFRGHAVSIINALRASPFVQILPATTELVNRGLEIYQSREDKEWGLTDCISFTAMHQHGLADVLTVDERFRQAGFRPLLLEEPGAEGGK